jgi:putative hydrolase of the HAD superfamily
MIKAILLDCDGPVIKRDKYFSQRLLDLGIKLDVNKIQDFFHKEFLLCETGKADLKQELAKRIKEWGWEKSLDELLDFWFSGEAVTDPKMIESIESLRQQGIMCYLITDQEKYRTEYLREIVGLKQHFDGIYSSCDVGYLKREKEYWEKVYQSLLQYPKREILAWDDDQRSIDAARQFGFKAGLYTNFENYRQLMQQEGLNIF